MFGFTAADSLPSPVFSLRVKFVLKSWTIPLMKYCTVYIGTQWEMTESGSKLRLDQRSEVEVWAAPTYASKKNCLSLVILPRRMWQRSKRRSVKRFSSENKQTPAKFNSHLDWIHRKRRKFIQLSRWVNSQKQRRSGRDLTPNNALNTFIRKEPKLPFLIHCYNRLWAVSAAITVCQKADGDTVTSLLTRLNEMIFVCRRLLTCC